MNNEMSKMINDEELYTTFETEVKSWNKKPYDENGNVYHTPVLDRVAKQFAYTLDKHIYGEKRNAYDSMAAAVCMTALQKAFPTFFSYVVEYADPENSVFGETYWNKIYEDRLEKVGSCFTIFTGFNKERIEKLDVKAAFEFAMGYFV